MAEALTGRLHIIFRKVPFQQIADWLNDKGYTSARGKVFGSSHVYSIVKKKRLRDQRISKDCQMTVSNFDLRFVDMTLINQV